MNRYLQITNYTTATTPLMTALQETWIKRGLNTEAERRVAARCHGSQCLMDAGVQAGKTKKFWRCMRGTAG